MDGYVLGLLQLENAFVVIMVRSSLEIWLDDVEKKNPLDYDEDGIHRCESRICGKNWRKI